MNEIEKQIIDLLLSQNKKMDIIINLLSNLTNTIIKYDTEYQNQIASGK